MAEFGDVEVLRTWQQQKRGKEVMLLAPGEGCLGGRWLTGAVAPGKGFQPLSKPCLARRIKP